MNGVIDNQTSGNDWTPGTRAMLMLHERTQEFLHSWPEVEQHSALKQFEQQVVHFEKEFRARLEDVRRLYLLPPDGSVEEFLGSHRALPQVLVSAIPQLRKAFPDTLFELRAESDEYGWENLYVDALWRGDALEAFDLLDRFGDEWWTANSASARGALTFTYRLV